MGREFLKIPNSVFLILINRLLHHLDANRFPSIPNCTAVGSRVISEVLHRTSPRYHFASSMVLQLIYILFYSFHSLEYIFRASSLSECQ